VAHSADRDRDVLVDKTAEIDAIPKFGRTEYAFVITGWMPVEDVHDLRTGISDRWREDIIIEQTEIREEEYKNTPVALKNDPRVEPFQKLLGFYGMPRYGTLDPSIFLFIFFPLFFGMIVGDIGYGLVMLASSWLRLNSTERDGAGLVDLGPAATMVVVFGFLYGEFFRQCLPRTCSTGYKRSIGR
jgi:V/A-type H+-transporting ATPase subunit I